MTKKKPKTSKTRNCIFLFCVVDITNQTKQPVKHSEALPWASFFCFQHHSYNIIMVLHLPLKSKHWRYCFRQHCVNKYWYCPEFFLTLANIFLCGFVYCCFHGLIILPLLFWCPQTVGSAVVDANTVALGGISTDQHMAGCLLWWLGVDSGGDRGVLPHPSRVAGVSEQCLYRVWTTAFPSHPFLCHTHAWIATHKTQTCRKHKTHIKCVQSKKIKKKVI